LKRGWRGRRIGEKKRAFEGRGILKGRARSFFEKKKNQGRTEDFLDSGVRKTQRRNQEKEPRRGWGREAEKKKAKGRKSAYILEGKTVVMVCSMKGDVRKVRLSKAANQA